MYVGAKNSQLGRGPLCTRLTAELGDDGWPCTAAWGAEAAQGLTPFGVFAKNGVTLPFHETQCDFALFQERICILCQWTVPLQFSLACLVCGQTLSSRHDLPIGFSQFRALVEHGLTTD